MTQAAAEGFIAILKALPKAQRDAVVVEIARDKALLEAILDLATIEERRNEPERPFREYVSGRRR